MGYGRKWDYYYYIGKKMFVVSIAFTVTILMILWLTYLGFTKAIVIRTKEIFKERKEKQKGK